jgi:preprotein translocase subunit SecG
MILLAWSFILVPIFGIGSILMPFGFYSLYKKTNQVLYRNTALLGFIFISLLIVLLVLVFYDILYSYINYSNLESEYSLTSIEKQLTALVVIMS